MIKKLLIIAILCSPVAVWALIKPVRVLAPEWVNGIECINETICTDNPSTFQMASELYEQSLLNVTEAIGKAKNKPRMVFCTTETCFRAFGLNRASAAAIAKYGIVISPRGWKPYYISHEIIHHVQAEQLGVLSAWLYPEWFFEGMAYSLSKDPRKQLTEPWQQYRTQFDAWYLKVGKSELWHGAAKL